MTDLPRLIMPMLASLRHEFPADEESYGWELKWDELRAVAYVENGKVRLISRNDKDMAGRIAKGLEGVVGKPLGSAYHPGQRRDWIKVKNVKQQEVIVAGWKPGEGRRADMIGSLLLGVNDDDGQLRYAGHVGTGF